MPGLAQADGGLQTVVAYTTPAVLQRPRVFDVINWARADGWPRSPAGNRLSAMMGVLPARRPMMKKMIATVAAPRAR